MKLPFAAALLGLSVFSTLAGATFPATFGAYLKTEMGRWGGAVKKAGVKLD